MSMRSAVVFAAAVLGACPAAASGSLDCQAEDKAVDLAIHAVFSHGLGAQFSNVQAELTLKAKAAAAAGPAKITFDAEQLVHHWFLGRDLKLMLYRDNAEGEPGGSVQVVVEARRSGGEDETGYAGRYEIQVQAAANDKPVILKGKASCSAG